MTLRRFEFMNELIVWCRVPYTICLIFLSFILIQCDERAEKLFNSVTSAASGIQFSNTITDVSKSGGNYYRAGREDAYAMVTLSSGRVYKHEFYYDSTYLSHSSRIIKVDPGVTSIQVFDMKGKNKSINISSLRN